VVSCNTTGIARAGAVLSSAYGIDQWDVTLVRRASDPGETKKGPINGILPTFRLPSHHGPDVQTIFPGLPITTTAVVVPTTLMHVHVNHVRLQRPPREGRELLERFRSTPRFHLFAGWERAEGTPQVMEFARDRGIGHNDMMENVLWEEGVKLDGQDAYFFPGDPPGVDRRAGEYRCDPGDLRHGARRSPLDRAHRPCPRAADAPPSALGGPGGPDEGGARIL